MEAAPAAAPSSVAATAEDSAADPPQPDAQTAAVAAEEASLAAADADQDVGGASAGPSGDAASGHGAVSMQEDPSQYLDRLRQLLAWQAMSSAVRRSGARSCTAAYRQRLQCDVCCWRATAQEIRKLMPVPEELLQRGEGVEAFLRRHSGLFAKVLLECRGAGAPSLDAALACRHSLHCIACKALCVMQLLLGLRVLLAQGPGGLFEAVGSDAADAPGCGRAVLADALERRWGSGKAAAAAGGAREAGDWLLRLREEHWVRQTVRFTPLTRGLGRGIAEDTVQGSQRRWVQLCLTDRQSPTVQAQQRLAYVSQLRRTAEHQARPHPQGRRASAFRAALAACTIAADTCPRHLSPRRTHRRPLPRMQLRGARS